MGPILAFILEDSLDETFGNGHHPECAQAEQEQNHRWEEVTLGIIQALPEMWVPPHIPEEDVAPHREEHEAEDEERYP